MSDFLPDTGSFRSAKHGQNAFGDVILKKYIPQEHRRIIVLSDGMGSGIKANVLASLTASMALNFAEANRDLKASSELIMNILPECSERKISYSTFTILDYTEGGLFKMTVYDNPLPVIIRNASEKDQEWTSLELTGRHEGKFIYTSSFMPEGDDRILAFTDGISQSGLGTGDGEWGRGAAEDFLRRAVKNDPGISSSDLCERLVRKAGLNDGGALKDDASCVGVYFRKPRELMICTGAPASKEKDFAFANRFRDFPGRKIIAGGTTSELIARELGLKFSGTMHNLNDGLPPVSELETADLVTEGVMTLSAVERLLRENTPEHEMKDGAAERIVRLINRSDRIHFLVGTSSNEFHYGLQYKMRVQLVKDIAETLGSVHFKETETEFF